MRLMPESGSPEWLTSGKTDANGVAKLSTHAKFSGAPAGTFKVCVSKIYDTPSQFTAPARDAPGAEWDAWRVNVENEKRPKYRHVKSEFDDVAKTPHSITVAKGRNSQTFDVGNAIEEIMK